MAQVTIGRCGGGGTGHAVRAGHLCNGRASDRRHADAEADQALLVDRHVEHAIRTELLEQPLRAAEHAAKAHVLTKDHGVRVRLERNSHRIVDGSEHVHLLGLAIHPRRC